MACEGLHTLLEQFYVEHKYLFTVVCVLGREWVLSRLFLMSPETTYWGGATKNWVSGQALCSSWLRIEGNYCGLVLFGPTYGSSRIKKCMGTCI